MVGSTRRQVALFHSPLDQQIAELKDDLLEPMDAFLDDTQLVDLVRTRLAGRRPASGRTGRRSIAPDRLLRCCVLKHTKRLSFRELEQQLRVNLLYRRFTRFDADVTPDHTTLSRNFALLGGEVLQAIHKRIVTKARNAGVVRGNKMRTDTTVVETNIHHPTDSSLLGDGVRVLTRVLKRVADHCEEGTLAVVDHSRAVTRRLLEISRAARSFTQASKERLTQGYQRLVGMTVKVANQAERVLDGLRSGKLRVHSGPVAATAHAAQLEHFLPLVRRVVAQTKQRVFGGDRHAADKVLSLFEPHTQVVRKGKPHKPTEFGRLVRIDEVENGIVSGVEVLDGNPADCTSWAAALEAHVDMFGQAPEMATADRGFFSAENERLAQSMGVNKVALPARGPLSASRRQRQKQRWFRRAQRWRTGIEARIATLKHVCAMARASFKEETGFKRYVGWCAIANNMVSIARFMLRRRARGKE